MFVPSVHRRGLGDSGDPYSGFDPAILSAPVIVGYQVIGGGADHDTVPIYGPAPAPAPVLAAPLAPAPASAPTFLSTPAPPSLPALSIPIITQNADGSLSVRQLTPAASSAPELLAPVSNIDPDPGGTSGFLSDHAKAQTAGMGGAGAWILGAMLLLLAFGSGSAGEKR